MTAIGAVSGVAMDTDALQHKKLTDTAQQFEAMFLQQLLKPLSAKEDAADQGEDKAGDTSTYQSLGVEAMASAVAKAGGMGIARSVVAQVGHEAAVKSDIAKGSSRIADKALVEGER